jgi:hypothetical protein
LNNPVENVLHYCNIMLSAKQLGEWHLEELKLMRSTCGMQDEINSGSLKLFSKELNKFHSSRFN